MSLPERPFSVNIRLPSYHPKLLEGLDTWLELGLISDSQVKQIASEHFVCRLVVSHEIVPELVQVTHDARQELPQPETLTPPKPPNALAGMLQSLMAELSVRWLLFLGMFLVVVSSGLLAASQWDKFPASGQYAVLFAYTLSFFGASFWAGKQSNLRLTAQALLVVTQLLLPVNFWAIDGFKLWQHPQEVLFAVIASIVLTVITILIGDSRIFTANLPHHHLRRLNILGLSYLHLGWSIPVFPLIAVYIAMVGTSFLTVYQTLYLERRNNEQLGRGITLSASVIIYALLLILFRAIFVIHTDISLLGLAIGICGWLAAWLALVKAEDTQQRLWQLVGATLLFFGWSVSVISYPGQALAVSGLSLWLFGRRLQLYNFPRDYFFVFAIGLQANWLIWRVIPTDVKSSLVAFIIQLTNSQNTPWTLLSLGLFPYLLGMTVVTEYLRQANKFKVAIFGENINFCFGVILTVIGLSHPGVVSWNLLLNTATLLVINKRRGSNASWQLIYLTHITAILTFCSFINWRLPMLSAEYWAIILLVLMVGEWLYSVGSGVWCRSAMHMGYGLAAVSFALLWFEASTYTSINYPQQNEWGLTWLAVPTTLTVISTRTEITRRPFLTISSVLAIGVAQFLTITVPQVRLISLAIATVLMFLNTNLLQQVNLAIVTVGFALVLESALLLDITKLNLLGIDVWLFFGAVNVLSLWVLRSILLTTVSEKENTNYLRKIYATALHKWALILCCTQLLLLTVRSILIYQGIVQPRILYLATITIILTAILFRTWRQPSNQGFYGIGLSLELFAAEALAFSGRTTIKIAVANIALGLIAQLFGEWWKRHHRIERLPNCFHVLPIIYAAFSVILRFDTFTSWTGLFTFGVAVIVIGVGRRYKTLKPLVYTGLIGISISLYELLFYQMLQREGGAYGDGLIAMSALGAIIMYVYRVLSPWLKNELRLTQPEIAVVANYHWVWSSCLLLIAIASPVEINRVIGLGTGAFLVRYAIFQGRATSISEDVTAKEIWVYLGLIQAVTISIFLRNLPIGRLFTQHLMPWNAAIVCIGAYFIYMLPWQHWGWSKKPWRNAAYILPLLIVALTWSQIYSVTLLITASFYIFVASFSCTFRLTYISVVLVNWALMRWFGEWRLDGLWYVTLIGLSFFYIAQFDPEIRLPSAKTTRHYLRLFGSSIICGYAIIYYQDTAWVPGVFSLISVFAGLALRIRAFLYVGTATFLITGIYQLVILSLRYSFVKWLISLCVGIILISIAANFETRRDQLSALVRSTSNEFEYWE
ncbi:MAG: DUF2157 domain-containing protein [Calothrix sp. C42_A2020_038]|nr:DUF2157 domain-containing protein [Calothrix sp. C42_A2020_038]